MLNQSLLAKKLLKFTDSFASYMVENPRSMSLQGYKIAWSIIESVAIFMMDGISCWQKHIMFLFPHKKMLRNIILSTLGPWMTRFQDHLIFCFRPLLRDNIVSVLSGYSQSRRSTALYYFTATFNAVFRTKQFKSTAIRTFIANILPTFRAMPITPMFLFSGYPFITAYSTLHTLIIPHGVVIINGTHRTEIL